MKVIGKFIAIFDRILSIMAILAGVLLGLATLMIGAEIAIRNLLGRPLGWVTEISAYILLYVTFLVAAWVLRKDRHVNIGFVLNLLKPKTQALICIITSVLITIVCLFLTWFGAKVTWDLYQAKYFEPTLLQLPKFPIIAIICLGSLLLFIQSIIRIFVFVERWKSPSEKKEITRVVELN